MKIKVCGLKNPQNIERIEECHPDFMGFIFYSRSGRAVNEETRSFLLGTKMKSAIARVGVFVNEKPEIIIDSVRRYDLDYVQLHGDEDLNYVMQLNQSGIPIVKVFHIDNAIEWKEVLRYEPYIRYFLFDTATSSYGGSGRSFDWTLLQDYPGKTPFFLSGGIGPEDIDKITELALPTLFAVDINSRFESSAGIKNDQLVSQFINQLRHENI